MRGTGYRTEKPESMSRVMAVRRSFWCIGVLLDRGHSKIARVATRNAGQSVYRAGSAQRRRASITWHRGKEFAEHTQAELDPVADEVNDVHARSSTGSSPPRRATNYWQKPMARPRRELYKLHWSTARLLLDKVA